MYCEEVCNNVPASGMSGLEKWERVRDGLVGAAESVIRYESRRQPDWFEDNAFVLSNVFVLSNAFVLRELIECRNMLFGRWLKSGSNGDRQKYVSQRRLIPGAVK